MQALQGCVATRIDDLPYQPPKSVFSGKRNQNIALPDPCGLCVRIAATSHYSYY